MNFHAVFRALLAVLVTGGVLAERTRIQLRQALSGELQHRESDVTRTDSEGITRLAAAAAAAATATRSGRPSPRVLLGPRVGLLEQNAGFFDFDALTQSEGTSTPTPPGQTNAAASVPASKKKQAAPKTTPIQGAGIKTSAEEWDSEASDSLSSGSPSSSSRPTRKKPRMAEEHVVKNQIVEKQSNTGHDWTKAQLRLVKEPTNRGGHTLLLVQSAPTTGKLHHLFDLCQDDVSVEMANDVSLGAFRVVAERNHNHHSYVYRCITASDYTGNSSMVTQVAAKSWVRQMANLLEECAPGYEEREGSSNGESARGSTGKESEHLRPRSKSSGERLEWQLLAEQELRKVYCHANNLKRWVNRNYEVAKFTSNTSKKRWATEEVKKSLVDAKRAIRAARDSIGPVTQELMKVASEEVSSRVSQYADYNCRDEKDVKGTWVVVSESGVGGGTQEVEKNQARSIAGTSPRSNQSISKELHDKEVKALEARIAALESLNSALKASLGEEQSKGRGLADRVAEEQEKYKGLTKTLNEARSQLDHYTESNIKLRDELLNCQRGVKVLNKSAPVTGGTSDDKDDSASVTSSQSASSHNSPSIDDDDGSVRSAGEEDDEGSASESESEGDDDSSSSGEQSDDDSESSDGSSSESEDDSGPPVRNKAPPPNPAGLTNKAAPPGSSNKAAPPGSSNKAAPPGSSNKAAPPGSSNKAAPPGSNKAAPPGSNKAAPPGSNKAAPPGSNKAAPPGSNKAAPPGGGNKASPPGLGKKAAPPVPRKPPNGFIPGPPRKQGGPAAPGGKRKPRMVQDTENALSELVALAKGTIYEPGDEHHANEMIGLIEVDRDKHVRGEEEIKKRAEKERQATNVTKKLEKYEFEWIGDKIVGWELMYREVEKGIKIAGYPSLEKLLPAFFTDQLDVKVVGDLSTVTPPYILNKLIAFLNLLGEEALQLAGANEWLAMQKSSPDEFAKHYSGVKPMTQTLMKLAPYEEKQLKERLVCLASRFTMTEDLGMLPESTQDALDYYSTQAPKRLAAVIDAVVVGEAKAFLAEMTRDDFDKKITKVKQEWGLIQRSIADRSMASAEQPKKWLPAGLSSTLVPWMYLKNVLLETTEYMLGKQFKSVDNGKWSPSHFDLFLTYAKANSQKDTDTSYFDEALRSCMALKRFGKAEEGIGVNILAVREMLDQIGRCNNRVKQLGTEWDALKAKANEALEKLEHLQDLAAESAGPLIAKLAPDGVEINREQGMEALKQLAVDWAESQVTPDPSKVGKPVPLQGALDDKTLRDTWADFCSLLRAKRDTIGTFYHEGNAPKSATSGSSSGG